MNSRIDTAIVSRCLSPPGCIIHANTLTTHYSYRCEPLALAREMYINIRVEIILFNVVSFELSSRRVCLLSTNVCTLVSQQAQ